MARVTAKTLDRAYRVEPAPARKTDRKKNSFLDCEVDARENPRPVYSVSKIDPITGRIKSSMTCLFSSRIPVGSYEIVDDCENYSVLRHKKTENHFVLDMQLFKDVKCRTCSGRGKIRDRKHPDLQDRRAYSERECDTCNGQGVENEFKTEIPNEKYPDNQVEKAVMEYLEIDSVFAFNSELNDWEIYPPKSRSAKVRKPLSFDKEPKKETKKSTNL